MLLVAAAALRTGQLVPKDAAKYLADALTEWFELGGDLERDHLRVAAEPGSHTTPRVVAIRLLAREVNDHSEAAQTLRIRSSRGQRASKDGRILKP
jgi:hypothetical protein